MWLIGRVQFVFGLFSLGMHAWVHTKLCHFPTIVIVFFLHPTYSFEDILITKTMHLCINYCVMLGCLLISSLYTCCTIEMLCSVRVSLKWCMLA